MAEIKHELDFGINNFGKQKMMTEAQSVAQVLINLLLMRPGQLPSLPHIGINIQKYLYKFKEDIDISRIKNDISYQCSALLPYINLSAMQLILVPYESETLLYLYIPLSVKLNEDVLLIGFKRDNSSNKVTFNYKITDNLT